MSGTNINIDTKGTQIQSDWNQSNNLALDYIKNKPSILKSCYVDGNNPNSGDGSILNPFQTIPQAISYVIGSGSISSPQRNNITIIVAAATYTTSANLYVNGLTWDFAEGATIVYTGAGHLIDNGGYTHDKIFKITGSLTMTTTTGGFIRNYGDGVSSPFNRIMDIEVYDARGLKLDTHPAVLPFVDMYKQTPSGGYQGPSLVLRVKSFFSSLQNYTFSVAGACRLQVIGYGDRPTVGYGGIDPVNVGLALGKVLYYNNNEISTPTDRRYLGNFTFKNLSLAGENCNSLITFMGFYGMTGGIQDCIFNASRGGGTVGRLIDFGDWLAVPYLGGGVVGKFIISNNTIGDLTITNDDIIRWTGSTGGRNKLDIQYNTFSSSQYINSNVDYVGNLGPKINTFGGSINMIGIPEYANNAAAVSGGLKVGNLFRTTGTGDIQVVI